MTPSLETDVAHAFAGETRKAIGKEIYGSRVTLTPGKTIWFFLHATPTVREMLWRGFLGLRRKPHVSGPSLKEAMHSMLSEAGLSSSSIRAQGFGLGQYDGEVLTELKSSFVSGNASAHYVHTHVCPLHSLLITASYDRFELYELFKAVDVLSSLLCGRSLK